MSSYWSASRHAVDVNQGVKVDKKYQKSSDMLVLKNQDHGILDAMLIMSR